MDSDRPFDMAVVSDRWCRVAADVWRRSRWPEILNKTYQSQVAFGERDLEIMKVNKFQIRSNLSIAEENCALALSSLNERDPLLHRNVTFFPPLGDISEISQSFPNERG